MTGISTTSQELRQALCELADSQDGCAEPAKYWKEVLPSDWQGPYPRHWCGGFALWCLHRSLGCDWLWGFGDHSGFLWRLKKTDDPQPGDICYQAEPYQHHAVLVARGIEDDGGRSTITIDGNQGAAPGVCKRVYRAHPKWTAYYSIEPLVQAELERLAGDLAHD
jgi:hypothetical protein